MGMNYEIYADEDLIDGVGFAREGSALRASTRRNPRNLPCPTCKEGKSPDSSGRGSWIPVRRMC